ncbi:serpin-ZXA-like [Carex rostrata]
MDLKLRDVITSQTSFSLRLSTHLLSLPGFSSSNLVFSPLSLHSVLALLTAGATGPTLQQLLSFLGSNGTSDLSTLHSHISNVLLADGSRHRGPCLRYACGVWVDASTNLNNLFREIAGSVYKAQADPLPFRSMPEECRNRINEWVEQTTAGHIKNLLTPGLVTSDTRLILGNALYFKGAWDESFDPLFTKTNIFHLIEGSSIEIPFMASGKRQFISVYDDFKVLKLPYEQGEDRKQYSFYLFLPNTFNGLLNLSIKLSSEPDFLNHHVPMKKVLVGDFRIPKFKISMEMKFSDILKNLGLVMPFTMTGDFSKMVESSDVRQYYVSEIVHKCFVGVNEEGTEAAAASAAIMRFGCAPLMGEPIDFVADHPFLFLIREDTSGVVLFAGHLMNPLLTEQI